jgi:CheY-like chemotaxis protein
MEKQIRVLLVDDKSDFLESISIWFEARGHSVICVYSGREAIEAVKSKAPHIVFLDINMPGMDGLETLSHIRDIDKDLPVIMVTAYSSKEKMEKAKELGASGFFPKIGELEDLANIMEVTLRTHKQLKESKQE